MLPTRSNKGSRIGDQPPIGESEETRQPVANCIILRRSLPRSETSGVLAIVATEQSSVPGFAPAVADIVVGTAPTLPRKGLKLDESLHVEAIAHDLPDRLLLHAAERNVRDERTGGHRAVDLDREHEVPSGAGRAGERAETLNEMGMRGVPLAENPAFDLRPLLLVRYEWVVLLLRDVLVEDGVGAERSLDKRVDLLDSMDVRAVDRGEGVDLDPGFFEGFDSCSCLLPRAVHADERIVLLLVARDQGDQGRIQTCSVELLSPFSVGAEAVGVQDYLWNIGSLFCVADDLGEITAQKRLSAEDLQPRACAGNVIQQPLDVRHWEKLASLLPVTHPAGEAASGVHLELDRPQDASHHVSQRLAQGTRSQRANGEAVDQLKDRILQAERKPRLQVWTPIERSPSQSDERPWCLGHPFRHSLLLSRDGLDQLAIAGLDPYDERIMERAIAKGVCLLMVATLTLLPVSGTDLPEDKVEQVRTWMTIGGAVLGLGIGIAGSLDLIPEETSLSDSLLVVIPTTAVTAATAALAGRWIAETALALRPTLVFSPLVGAGLGMVGGALSGGISFALGMAIAIPAVDVSVGEFTYLQAIGMAALGGALWGGIFGIPAGAVAVPIISLVLNF